MVAESVRPLSPSHTNHIRVPVETGALPHRSRANPETTSVMRMLKPLRPMLCVAIPFLLGFAVEAGEAAPTESRPTPKSVKEKAVVKGNPIAVLETSQGTIRVELWPDKAPKTVENFVQYIEDGFYDNLIFHRVIKDFMIQGGGFHADMKKADTRPPIKNEARADTPNRRGTLAMARTPDPHSASAQFFINLKDNNFLNFKSATPQGYGYAVFGKVVDGMDIVDKIAAVTTGKVAGYADVPLQPIVIQNATVMRPQ